MGAEFIVAPDARIYVTSTSIVNSEGWNPVWDFSEGDEKKVLDAGGVGGFVLRCAARRARSGRRKEEKQR